MENIFLLANLSNVKNNKEENEKLQNVAHSERFNEYKYKVVPWIKHQEGRDMQGS